MQTPDSTLKLKINFFGFMNSSISSGKTVSLYSRICKLIKEYRGCKWVSTSFAVETIAGIPSIFRGAVMGANEEGVIDKTNGYEILYIIDGSMISANLCKSLYLFATAATAMDQIPFKSTATDSTSKAAVDEVLNCF
jgi:hypothetical protein